MLPFLLPLAVAALIVAIGTTLMVRRDRRRMSVHPDTPPMDSAVIEGIRVCRLPARAYRNRFGHEHG
ncbi:hypothetical protein AB0L66_22770 [Streptomyces sp. NPDC052207]|uniref:hypothetical protein n=1 Tax=Streptomyces sp. NPDC052207 TaxID=3155418 RepID=UPI003448CBE9